MSSTLFYNILLSNILHDAKKGFHDIKGLSPETISDTSYFDKIILIAIIAAIIFYLFNFLKGKRKYAHLPANEKAKRILKDILNDLRSKKISTRQYSSNSSITIRDYLSQRYEFNATELTNIEVIKKLEKLLKNDQVMFKNISKILKNYDKVTFSDVDYSNISEFEKLTGLSENLVDKINDI